MLRYYKVFNISQLESVPNDIIPKKQERRIYPIVACEKILHNMSIRPEILHEGNQACYVPHLDKIFMPTRKSFLSSEFYYSTLFHEIIHSTRHETRLNRKGIADYSVFDHEAYSQEELVAEIGACFLHSHAGINTEDMSNNIAYIQSWLMKLEDDKRMIIYASTQAQKAVDWVMGVEN